MSNSAIILTIAGAAAATFLTRFPLMLLSGRKIPLWLEKLMSYIAPAVLTALIIPAVVVKEGRLDMALSNDYVPAAVVAVLTAYFSKNMLVTILAGVCTVGLLSFL